MDHMLKYHLRAVLLLLPLVAASLHQETHTAETTQEQPSALGVAYLEIVTPDRDATCELLEEVHGVTFGEPVAAFGGARTAPLRGGGTLGVREPMRETEAPVVRPYLEVVDIEAAVKAAAANGGQIAMPPTPITAEEEFAIYLHGGIQHGLWTR